MTKKQYYEIMCNMDTKRSFKVLHENWFRCFEYILKSFKVGFTKKVIHSLFYNWTMENWTAMHQEETEYKGYTKKKLIGAFCGECCYISDRVSYDRLFRTHWLFLRSFENELNKIRYPNLYKNK
jgi:hypothetical protein